MREHTEKQAVDYKYSSNYLIQPPACLELARRLFSMKQKRANRHFGGYAVQCTGFTYLSFQKSVSGRGVFLVYP